MNDSPEKPDPPAPSPPAPSQITGKADPIPGPLVVVLAFFGSGSAGYFLNLIGLGVVSVVLNLDGPIGKLGALQMNLSAAACAAFGMAIAMAFQGRPIRGFAASFAAASTVAALIGLPWHGRFLDHGYAPGDVLIFFWPFFVSCVVGVFSLLGLAGATLLHFRRT